ncbi:P-loop containing nucleoside triphosphate hydrolase protein [Xylariaceae sp. FL0804]|nr:P-loop containing nucleoside triphosphate hydrolase protein [Xylariaceae sp. FL0804]
MSNKSGFQRRSGQFALPQRRSSAAVPRITQQSSGGGGEPVDVELGAPPTVSSFSRSSSLATTADDHGKQGWWKPKIPGVPKAEKKAKTESPPPKPRNPTERPVSPEEAANWLSKLTFSWIGGLLWQGFRHPLKSNDIPRINSKRRIQVHAATVRQKFEDKWKQGKPHPLRDAIYETFKTKFWIAGVCRLFGDLLLVGTPYTLRYLIEWVLECYYANQQKVTPPPLWHGIAFLAGIICMQMSQSLLQNHYSYMVGTIGGQSRAVLISAIFDKSVKILGQAGTAAVQAEVEEAENEKKKKKPKKGKGKGKDKKNKKKKAQEEEDEGYTISRVTNLLTVDTSRIDVAAGALHTVWTAPVALFAAFALLIVNLGTSALVGLGVLILGMMSLLLTVGSVFKQRKISDHLTDVRVSATQEALSGIRLIKYFNWNDQFAKRIMEFRQAESKSIHHFLLSRNVIAALSQSMPYLTAMLSFVTYALTHNGLSPAIVFSSTSLFNTLRIPLTFLPVAATAIAESWVSLRRIEDFLMTHEPEPPSDKPSFGAAVDIRHATFVWDARDTGDDASATDFGSSRDSTSSKDDLSKKSSSYEGSTIYEESIHDDDSIGYSLPGSEGPRTVFALRDIDISIKRGEFLCIIGTIGAGKSSLLSAMCGDMHVAAGHIARVSSLALAPQVPWIHNSTVRDNIVFGHPFDRSWYRTVVKACGLKRDIEILTHGDSTMVGEKGSVLSGGQKQRISLARAMYSRADLVLLDDPLSAIDANVGRSVLDQAICGQMANKTRIMATHALHMLYRADRILWLENGHVRALDTHANLMAQDPVFARMIRDARGAQRQTMLQAPPGSDLIVPNRTSVFEEDNNDKGEGENVLMTDESEESRSVSWKLYGAFFATKRSILMAILTLPVLAVAQGCTLLMSQWLSWWSSGRYDVIENVRIGVYAALAGGQLIFIWLFASMIATICVGASQRLTNQATLRVMAAPVSYFDTTPLGRMINRFSKDVETMDFNLTEAIRMYLYSLTSMLAIFILIIVYFYWFAIAAFVVCVVLTCLASYYRRSARELKRHEAVLRSTAISRFVEGLTGVPTIRSFRQSAIFSEKLCEAIDNMDSAYFLTFANSRWLNLRLDALGATLLAVMGILVIMQRNSQNPSTAGMVLSLTINAVQVLQVVVKQWADVENSMNSTERLYGYANNVPQERDAAAELGPAEPAPPLWPREGGIDFIGARMRYRPGLPEALKGLNLRVHGGERLAIVGRTGAGKSTLVNTLFRSTELCGGLIKIDGKDISRVDLGDLRNRLSIIPQDTALFSGTIRTNLDPFDEHTDAELWSAIRSSGLQDLCHLSDPVEDGGDNLSNGQKQLLALARVLVRRNQIVICDEATAALDSETDARIQLTMRHAFRGKTVLYIAHRLQSVLSFDRVCVMDQGKLAELDTPINLFRQKNGIFRDMCVKAGISDDQVVAAKIVENDESGRSMEQPFGVPFEQSFEQYFAQWV